MGGSSKFFFKEEPLGGTLRFFDKMFEPPEVPDAPIPDAPVQKGEEGIRRGEMQKQSKRRALGQAYLTKGQSRSSGGTLGGTANTLG